MEVFRLTIRAGHTGAVLMTHGTDRPPFSPGFTAAQLAAASLEEWASIWDDLANFTEWRLLDAGGRVSPTARVDGL
jgi:hypothetical protein